MRQRFLARGFSLIELLLVVALIGLVALIGGGELTQLKQRWDLTSAAREMTSTLKSVRNLAQRRAQVVEVQLVTGPPRELQVRTPAGEILRRYRVPDFVNFSATTAGGVDATWPKKGGIFTLACDPVGRLVDPNTRQPLWARAVLPITHVNMVKGSLRPKIVYISAVTPLWEAALERNIQP